MTAVLAACVTAVLLGACGSSSSSRNSHSSSSTLGSSTAATSAAADAVPVVASSGSCGTLPYVAPSDPDGVVKALGSRYQSNYVGFTDFPIVKSAWSDWKPAKSSGWTVQILWQPLVVPLQGNALKALEAKLRSTGKVSSIQVQTTSSVTDVAQQLQQFGTAIQRRPTIIVVEPNAAPPLVPLIAKAAKAGIPVVSVLNATNSRYAVNVATNSYLNAGLPAAGVLKLMHGRGDVLEVHGVPGSPADIDAFTAFGKALSRCPGVKVAGQVTGDFTPSVAKSAVQQFLATHPAGVQGAFQVGVMGQSVLQAFMQSGHTPPPLADPGAVEGVIAYWHKTSAYNEVATATPDDQWGTAYGNVTLRMLEGQGPKLNTILRAPYVITRANLDRVWNSSFAQDSPLDAAGPSATFMPDAYLDGMFEHPSSR